MKIRELDILLVEDNPGDVLLLVETLADCGLDRRRFTTVTSLGAIFEHFAAGARADVILLDLNLPDSKGLATLERLWAWLPDKVPGYPGKDPWSEPSDWKWIPLENLNVVELKAFIPASNAMSDIDVESDVLNSNNQLLISTP